MNNITLAGTEYPVSFGHLAFSIYMQSGRNMNQIRESDNIYHLFYAAMKAGAKRCRTEFSMDYDDFLIALDDTPDSFNTLTDIMNADQQPKK